MYLRRHFFFCITPGHITTPRWYTNIRESLSRPPFLRVRVSPIIFLCTHIGTHHSQHLNAACAVPVQKKWVALKWAFIGRSSRAVSPPSRYVFPSHTQASLPFFLLLSRYHISIQPPATTTVTTSTRYPAARPDLNPACAVPRAKRAL